MSYEHHATNHDILAIRRAAVSGLSKAETARSLGMTINTVRYWAKHANIRFDQYRQARAAIRDLGAASRLLRLMEQLEP